MSPSELDAIREVLAERRAGGDFQPLSLTLTLVPRLVRVDAVSANGSQVYVKYDDGVSEALNASEIATLAAE